MTPGAVSRKKATMAEAFVGTIRHPPTTPKEVAAQLLSEVQQWTESLIWTHQIQKCSRKSLS
jgi:hypothetical protein